MHHQADGSSLSKAYLASAVPELEEQFRLTEAGIGDCASPHKRVIDAIREVERLTKQKEGEAADRKTSTEARDKAGVRYRAARMTTATLHNAEAALARAKQMQASAAAPPLATQHPPHNGGPQQQSVA